MSNLDSRRGNRHHDDITGTMKSSRNQPSIITLDTHLCVYIYSLSSSDHQEFAQTELQVHRKLAQRNEIFGNQRRFVR